MKDENGKFNEDQDDLVAASYDGNFDLVRSLIAEGADPNATNEYGETGVMVAAENGYDAIIEFLLDNGAKINAKDKDGDTALDIARYYGHQSTTDYLLERGATGDDGHSAKEKLANSYYDACDDVDAIKRLTNKINEKNK